MGPLGCMCMKSETAMMGQDKKVVVVESIWLDGLPSSCAFDNSSF